MDARPHVPMCIECEAEPADLDLRHPSEEGDPIPICNACLRGLFDRIMGERSGTAPLAS